MAIKYDEADAQRVKQIKERMLESLRPFMHNTEALLVAIAAGQIARDFLSKYPVAVMREQVEKVFIPFLRRETYDEAAGSIIDKPFNMLSSLLGPPPSKRRKH